MIKFIKITKIFFLINKEKQLTGNRQGFGELLSGKALRSLNENACILCKSDLYQFAF